eukprot:jgi/Mesen1/5397/ME000268S04601
MRAIEERGARIVLIGEASHGTHEFYSERAKITRRLIEEQGFNVVLAEADWPDAIRVHRYVRGYSVSGSDADKDNADEARADKGWGDRGMANRNSADNDSASRNNAVKDHADKDNADMVPLGKESAAVADGSADVDADMVPPDVDAEMGSAEVDAAGGDAADKDANEALSGFLRFPQWMWRNAVMLEFVEWMKKHNLQARANQQQHSRSSSSSRRRILCQVAATQMRQVRAATVVPARGWLRRQVAAAVRKQHRVVVAEPRRRQAARRPCQESPEAAEKARKRYACFDHVSGDPQLYGALTARGLIPDCERSAVRVLADLRHMAAREMRRMAEGGRRPQQEQQHALDELFYAEMVSRRDRNEHAGMRAYPAGEGRCVRARSFGPVGGAREEECQLVLLLLLLVVVMLLLVTTIPGEQNARVVKDAERYYRAMFESRDDSWNLRDTHMVCTLAQVLNHVTASQGRPAKAVVWAHNSHVGDARATEMGKRRGEVNVGQLVRQSFPGEAFNIGFSTYAGTVTAADTWDGHAWCKRVNPGLPGSYEEAFHKAAPPGVRNFYLDLHKCPIRESRLQRAIGVIYRPDTERYSHYFEAALADQFDAIIHIDETTAVEPLERDPKWDRKAVKEPPETYPFGV